MKVEVLPGWFVEEKGDVLGTVTIEGPNGYSTYVNSSDRNPAIILRMLALDLLKQRASTHEQT